MRKSLKITLTNTILRVLEELGDVTLDAFFPKKYPRARLWRDFFETTTKKVSRRSLSAILSRLHRQGLVERRGPIKESRWRISTKGATKIKDSFRETPKSDGKQRLVIFDIPETQKRKRAHIRSELIAHNYNMLQKSVWIGTTPLSRDFIELIDALHLAQCIHILSIRDQGTLKN